MRTWTVFLGACVVAASAAGACKASNHTSSSSGGAGANASGGATTGPTTTSSGLGGAFTGSGGAGGGGCDIHCSADLHQVLDCNENVLKTCPADQGCAPGGMCVSPCDSAKANASTIGCDFYSAIPASIQQLSGSCFAVLLANTWTSPISIDAEIGGQKLDVAGMARKPVGSGKSISYQPLSGGMLAPGEIAILFLMQGPSFPVIWTACPQGVTPGISTDDSVKLTGLGQAFHITTSAPVVAYDIYPYGGAQSFATSATLLLPTPSWGTNAMAADGFATDPSLGVLGQFDAFPYVQVVAAEDNTKVTISPSVAIMGGPNVKGTGQGQPVDYILNKGQMLQLEQPEELAGSPVQSDKPVSLWGGHGCLHIPIGMTACDSAHQQLTSINALGHEYLAVRYKDRVPNANEAVPWTIVGVATDATILTYDPAPPPGAPLALKSGEMVRFTTSTPFTVRSQDEKHPFYISGHMPGGDAVGMGVGAGDPEYVNVVPPQQYLASYLFLTDPTYAQTSLVFTRQKGKDGTFKDVDLDCVGTISGWQPIGNEGKYQYAYVDLVQSFQPQGKCDNGVHTAKSDVPFGLTVWGWDYYVSYAYPAGMSVKPINTVVVPPVPK